MSSDQMTGNLHGFRQIEAGYIEELQANAVIYQHQRLGTKLLHIPCSDNNKVFNIEFVTMPEDNTGVAHILEHSVLCGSEKFPLKEPFLNLMKSSLNTFLNAMTFPDKTMYPFASLNEKDFMNILEVYLDAVFRPNIRKDPLILKQEGWRYEIFAEGDRPKYNGVVFNEMKGAMSSPDSKLSSLSHSLLFDNTYQYNSGGDPEAIVDLTEQDFLDFYEANYHPANCLVFLYGDAPLEPVLEALDRKFEFYENTGRGLTPPVSATKLIQPQYAISDYPAARDAMDYAQIEVVFPHDKAGEKKENEFALQLIAEAMFNMESSPLRQKLLESGLAQEIYAYLDSTIFNPTLSIVLVGVNAKSPERIEQILWQEMTEFARNDQRALFEAGLNTLSFNLREGDTRSMPSGLIYSFNAMINWPYGRSPLDSLAYENALSKLSVLIRENTMSDLIREYILQNPHRVTVLLHPNPEFSAMAKALEEQKLTERFAALSAAEKAEIIARNKALREKQSTPDSTEDLATIPRLLRKDLDRKHHYQALTKGVLELAPDSFASGKEAFTLPLLTYFGLSRGILYLSYQFDVSDLKNEDLFALSTLDEIIGLVQTENYSYQDLTNFYMTHTGGISISLVNQKERQYFEVKTKFLAKQTAAALEILDEILLRSDLSGSQERIYQLLTTLYSRMKLNMADNGINYAKKRLLSYFDQNGKFDEVTSGFDFYRQLEKLLRVREENGAAFIEQIQRIFDKIIRRERLTVYYSGEESLWQELKPRLQEHLAEFPKMLERAAAPIQRGWRFAAKNLQEALAIDTDVQYVLAGNNLKSLNPNWQFNGNWYFLRQIINTDYLWNRVRVKGGAYGCSLNIDRFGILYMYSYRDPECAGTYRNYQEIPAYLRSLDLSEEELTSYLIGAISNLDQPLSFPASAKRALNFYDCGITLDDLQRERDQLLSVKLEDVKAYADLLEAALAENIRCTVGNLKKLTEDKDWFKEIVEVN